ncbi:MAG: putative transposase [Paracoccaceae bacterium]|jgi:putative transposase
MKAVVAQRCRFGYGRIRGVLDRRGIVMNLKKLRRLYREEKLPVRRRGGPKRMVLPDAANQRFLSAIKR